jgi:hypothetical protein
MKKVFCIGFHKTGTTSIGKALELLGYNVCGVQPQLVPFLKDKNYQPVFDLVAQYDAFQDNPWPVLFRRLDQQFPRSKFIFTYREPYRWIKSCLNQFGSKRKPMRAFIYGPGAPKGSEDVYLKRYNEHTLEVLHYFKGRKDLLTLEIDRGDFNWTKICNFLELPIPNMLFPHENRRRSSSF